MLEMTEMVGRNSLHFVLLVRMYYVSFVSGRTAIVDFIENSYFSS